MPPKKALNFPTWLEAAIVLLLLLMGVIEYNHNQWAWALIFALSGIAFGASLAIRLLTGDKHDGK